MIEDHLPLVELRDVVMKLVVAGDERPHVVAVAAGVVRKKGHRVHTLRREVVDRADQPFAFVAFPGRVARLPVRDVRREGMQRHLRLARDGAVEVGVGEQRLRRIGAELQKIVAGAGKLKIVFARVLQAAACAKVGRFLVGRANLERPRPAVERRNRLAGRRRGQCDRFPRHERNPIVPPSGLVRRQMRAPFVAGCGRGVGGITIAGKIPRHPVGRRARLVGKGHRHPIVHKRVRRVRQLVCLRSGERQRHLVPLPKLSRDRDVGAAPACCRRLGNAARAPHLRWPPRQLHFA